MAAAVKPRKGDSPAEGSSIKQPGQKLRRAHGGLQKASEAELLPAESGKRRKLAGGIEITRKNMRFGSGELPTEIMPAVKRKSRKLLSPVMIVRRKPAEDFQSSAALSPPAVPSSGMHRRQKNQRQLAEPTPKKQNGPKADDSEDLAHYDQQENSGEVSEKLLNGSRGGLSGAKLKRAGPSGNHPPDSREVSGGSNRLQRVPALADVASRAELAEWLWKAYCAHFGAAVAALEQQSISEESFVVVKKAASEDPIRGLARHLKAVVGPSWPRVLLTRGEKPEGKNEGKENPTQGGESRIDGEEHTGMDREAASERDEDPTGKDEAGRPAVIIVCSSAKRCTEMLRGVRGVGRTCRVTKLFAKHMKVEEQVAALQQPVNVAAGTPNRLGQLVGLGALRLSHLAVLLLDLERTAKGLTLLDIPEVRVDFWEFYRAHLHPLVTSGQLKICLY